MATHAYNPNTGRQARKEPKSPLTSKNFLFSERSCLKLIRYTHGIEKDVSWPVMASTYTHRPGNKAGTNCDIHKHTRNLALCTRQ